MPALGVLSIQGKAYDSKGEWQRIEAAAEMIQRADVSIVNIPNLCVENLYDELIELKETDRPGVILIDNLRFLTTRKKCKNRQREYCVIAQRLGKLGKETGIPVVLSGQDILNITVVKNPDGSYGYREIEYDLSYNKLKNHCAG